VLIISSKKILQEDTQEKTKVATPPTTLKEYYTSLEFPVSINYDNAKFDIMGLGSRLLTIFRVHVYGIALYVDNESTKLEFQKWKNNDSKKLEAQKDFYKDIIYNNNFTKIVRVVPSKNVAKSHFLDGFLNRISKFFDSKKKMIKLLCKKFTINLEVAFKD